MESGSPSRRWAKRSKTGAPGSARSTLIAFGAPPFWRAWEELTYSLETGQPAFDKLWGMPFFDYLGQHPEAASHFSEAMVGFHGSEPPTVAEAYDFSGIQTVVDVGGATGNMLAAVLSRHTGLRGVLYDLPHVVGDAAALLKARGVEDRVTIETGSFFERVPAGGDAYLLSHIIHDWSEEKCLTILRNCREAMRPDGRILIVETVLPEGDTPHQGKLQDLVMLLVPGGQERSEKEDEELLGKGGLPAASSGADDIGRQHRGRCAGVAGRNTQTPVTPAPVVTLPARRTEGVSKRSGTRHANDHRDCSFRNHYLVCPVIGAASSVAWKPRQAPARWTRPAPGTEICSGSRSSPNWARDGPQVAILRVDARTHATQLLIHMPKQMHVPMHWHSANETHTMIKGTMVFEHEGKRHELGPGGFNYLPARMHHQAWSSETTGAGV